MGTVVISTGLQLLNPIQYPVRQGIKKVAGIRLIIANIPIDERFVDYSTGRGNVIGFTFILCCHPAIGNTVIGEHSPQAPGGQCNDGKKR